LRGPRQKVSGPDVEVTREDLEEARTYDLPHPPSKGLEPFLSPSPFIQSDDPQIRSRVSRVLNGQTDAIKAVERMVQWIHRELEKIPAVSVPSAVEVLRTLQGDCNEHAVLFAAMARAAGIPAKVSAGLLYQEGRFFYHAWNEVYLGRWISLDALLGQFPADATHIKFVEGELDQQAQLVPLIGTLKAEILAYR